MEVIDSSTQTIEHSIKNILLNVGEDIDREGLKETPKRFTKYFKEITTKEPFDFTTFDSEGYNQMIVQKNIPFYSMCEHHLAPFFGIAHVAYIPRKRIVGLSKLTRAVTYHSKGLQNQERITNNVAKMLQEKLDPVGVAVILKARHMCMEMRGVNKSNIETVTSALNGNFFQSNVKSEFMELIK